MPLRVRKRITEGGEYMGSICQFDLGDIGDRIRNCRKNNKMTQEELAEIIDVSSNAISLIETGQQCFRIDKLDRLARALNVSTDYLIYGQERHSEENGIEEEILSELSYLSEIELKKILVCLKAARKIA